MLNIGDKLRGFAGQSMGGPKTVDIDFLPTYEFVGTYTFSAPVAGRYKFYLRGGGGPSVSRTGGGSAGGGSGAYCEVTRAMTGGEKAIIVVGTQGRTGSIDAEDTTVTFADGRVVTAGGGKAGASTGTGGAGGVASGGDVNLNGSKGGDTDGTNVTAPNPALGNSPGSAGVGFSANAGGGGAPANSPYKGGNAYNGATGLPNGGPEIGAGGGASITQTAGGRSCVTIHLLSGL